MKIWIVLLLLVLVGCKSQSIQTEVQATSTVILMSTATAVPKGNPPANLCVTMITYRICFWSYQIQIGHDNYIGNKWRVADVDLMKTGRWSAIYSFNGEWIIFMGWHDLMGNGSFRSLQDKMIFFAQFAMYAFYFR